MTEPEPLQQIDRTYVLWRGQKLSYFSGCDYFRLASSPNVLRALNVGLKQCGLNVAASRLTTGNHVLYERLEEHLSRFFKVETALLVPTGYTTNLVVAQALTGQFSHALIDEAAHPSLADASVLLNCPVIQFAHHSVTNVASIVNRCGPGARLILLTDGMFSRDGSVAPLSDYLKILPSDAVVLVDDAHGAGVLGRHGRGAVEYTGAKRHRTIQTITLSKAFGTYGGAILGTRALRNAVLKHSRIFIGSTPLPLPIVNAALKALTILQQNQELRPRLFRKACVVKDALKKAGIELLETPGPIIALGPKGNAAAARIRTALLKSKIYPSFIKYPGGPVSGYFRFVISSEHSPAQLRGLIDALMSIAGDLVAVTSAKASD